MRTQEEILKTNIDKVNALYARKNELKADLLDMFVLSIKNDSINSVADTAIDEILDKLEDIESKINKLKRILYKDKTVQRKMIVSKFEQDKGL